MEKTWREKIEGTTDQILAQIRKLLDEGNIRRVVVKHQGKTVAEFPLTVGVVGTVIAPVAAAIGALTAVLAECTIEVEKATAGGAAVHVGRPEAPRRAEVRPLHSLVGPYTPAPCSGSIGSCYNCWIWSASLEGRGHSPQSRFSPTTAGVPPT